MIMKAGIAAAALVVTLASSPVFAQSVSRPYAGVAAGMLGMTGEFVDGRAPAASLVAGTGVLPWLDVELDVMVPSDTFRRSRTGISVSFAGPGASLEEFERSGVVMRTDHTRSVRATVAVVAVFHPPATGRVIPGFLLGLTNHRVHDASTSTNVFIPEGIDPDHPSIRPGSNSSIRNFGGPTIGVNLAVAISRRVVVAPDVRYNYASLGDEINNFFATSVRVLWRF
jgi:hypothetical protein